MCYLAGIQLNMLNDVCRRISGYKIICNAPQVVFLLDLRGTICFSLLFPYVVLFGCRTGVTVFFAALCHFLDAGFGFRMRRKHLLHIGALGLLAF